jgi:hypothetical protein
MYTPETAVRPSAHSESLTRRGLDMREAFAMDTVAIAQPASQCRSRATDLRTDGPGFTWSPHKEWDPRRLRPHCKGQAP